MVAFLGEARYAHTDPDCTGILLTNLGTPDAPTTPAVRRYLREFLSDPRVIEFPRLPWWLVLNGVILLVRPPRTAALYRTIWQREGSPLRVIAERQQRALQERLATRFRGALTTALGMRYGNPSISAALDRLRAAGARRLLVLPLYPQYSATTTGSTFDAVSQTLQRWRWLPELRFVTHYHDHGGYVGALAASVRESWARHGPGQRLLFSFHGLPERYLRAGDPYHCQCHKTARLVCERLGLGEERWAIAFQSRVGREPWLRPYTDELLAEWGRGGIESVDVICPGFSADCLETLEEIALRNREHFLEAGGRAYHYIPALNDRPDHVEALADVVLTRTADWQAQAEPAAETEVRAARLARARARGAER